MYYTTPEYRGETVPCLYTLKPVKRDVDKRRGRSYSRQRLAYLRLLQQLFGARVTPDCAVFYRIRWRDHDPRRFAYRAALILERDLSGTLFLL